MFLKLTTVEPPPKGNLWKPLFTATSFFLAMNKSWTISDSHFINMTMSYKLYVHNGINFKKMYENHTLWMPLHECTGFCPMDLWKISPLMSPQNMPIFIYRLVIFKGFFNKEMTDQLLCNYTIIRSSVSQFATESDDFAN